MNPSLLLRLLSASLLALLLTSCSTSSREARIKEKSAAFAELDPDEQEVIRNGYILIGYTPDMVYMALDKPEKVIPAKNGSGEEWIYRNFYAADGSSIMPATKVKSTLAPGGIESIANPGPDVNKVVLGRQTPSYQVEYDPIAQNMKTESTIRVHVIFSDGKVSDIQVINDGKV